MLDLCAERRLDVDEPSSPAERMAQVSARFKAAHTGSVTEQLQKFSTCWFSSLLFARIVVTSLVLPRSPPPPHKWVFVREQRGADTPLFIAAGKKPAGQVRRVHGTAVHQPRRECSESSLPSSLQSLVKSGGR